MDERIYYSELKRPRFCKFLWAVLFVSAVIFGSVFVQMLFTDFSYLGLSILALVFLLVNFVLILVTWAFDRYFINVTQNNMAFGYSHWNTSLDVEKISSIEQVDIRWVKWGGMGWRVRAGKKIGYITGNGAGVGLLIDGGRYYEFNCDNPQALIECIGSENGK